MLARSQETVFFMAIFNERVMAKGYAASLALLPLLAIIAPRAMAGLPAIIGLGGLIGLTISHRRLPAFELKSCIIVCAILSLSLCSALWAVDAGEVLGRTLKTVPVLIGLVLMVCAVQGMDKDGLREGTKFLPFAFITASLLMALEYVLDFPIYRALNAIPETQKINASFLNRGLIVLALTLFASTGVASEFGKHKWIWMAACLLSFMAAAFQGSSQSAQLGMFAGLFCMAMFPMRNKWAWRTLPVLIALLLFSLPWIAHWAFIYADQVDASSWLGKGGAYGAQRLEIWHFIARAIFAHPWLGYGTEAARVMTFDSQLRFFDSNTVLHPHNFGMQIWLEFGALGIALACAMFAWIVRMIESVPMPERRFVFAGFVTSFAVACTAYGMWQGWWLGLLTLVVAYMVMMVTTDENP